jgi:hypothetical protein
MNDASFMGKSQSGGHLPKDRDGLSGGNGLIRNPRIQRSSIKQFHGIEGLSGLGCTHIKNLNYIGMHQPGNGSGFGLKALPVHFRHFIGTQGFHGHFFAQEAMINPIHGAHTAPPEGLNHFPGIQHNLTRAKIKTWSMRGIISSSRRSHKAGSNWYLMVSIYMPRLKSGKSESRAKSSNIPLL